MKSVWSDHSEIPEFPAPEGDIKTDVLIIGGGLVGVLCASLLKDAGVDCVLAEADRVCRGVTKNTTAKITAQHGLIYAKLLRQFGAEKAKMYLDANLLALQKYREMCANMDCDFEEKSSFVYSVGSEKKLADEMEALNTLGFPAVFRDSVPLPLPTVGAVEFPEQAQFDPLKFAARTVEGLNIYEHTPVRELTGLTAVTGHGKIQARKIIVCTHFPFINKHGSYFLKMYQHRSYVLALSNAQDVGGMYVDEAQNGYSFRNYNGLLLLGGGGHRTGKSGGGWEVLEHFAEEHYPNAREKYRWATQDCVTLDGCPYIGQYSKNTPDFYVATGFNKWGMTSSMAAAMILTDMVTGKENPYAPVFSPSRTILRPQLAVNAAEAVAGLLAPSKKRCPHLGCGLKWNPRERTWDCSCHGSRFEEDGALIDNPATGDLKQGKK